MFDDLSLDGPKPALDRLAIFGGTRHPYLAQAIAYQLGLPLGRMQVHRFTNECLFPQIEENVRERDVFFVQPLYPSTSDAILELLIALDAFKRASAGRITAVLPYFSYGRSDKKDQPRVPITARLIADMIETAGANRVLTIDLHAGQIQGFFRIPVDELTAAPLLASAVRALALPDPVVVSTDLGFAKRARTYAVRLDTPVAFVEKWRRGNTGETEAMDVVGNVMGKSAILVDDEIDTAGSMTGAAALLMRAGARQVVGLCTHALLSGPAAQRLADSPITTLCATDTVFPDAGITLAKLRTTSIAPLLGEAIRRIHTGESVGALFDAVT